MKRVLLVDDLRNFRTLAPEVDLTIARTSQQGLDILAEDAQWDEIWLDHDLGDESGEIDDVMRVVDYLSERAFNDEPVKVGTVFVHTSNPPGSRAMLAALGRFGYTAVRVAPEPYFIVGTEAGSDD